jgi:hypothetical protein
VRRGRPEAALQHLDPGAQTQRHRQRRHRTHPARELTPAVGEDRPCLVVQHLTGAEDGVEVDDVDPSPGHRSKMLFVGNRGLHGGAQRRDGVGAVAHEHPGETGEHHVDGGRQRAPVNRVAGTGADRLPSRLVDEVATDQGGRHGGDARTGGELGLVGGDGRKRLGQQCRR